MFSTQSISGAQIQNSVSSGGRGCTFARLKQTFSNEEKRKRCPSVKEKHADGGCGSREHLLGAHRGPGFEPSAARKRNKNIVELRKEGLGT